jgi:hypothetical protein
VTAEKFYEFCSKRKACKEGLAAISGLTASEWWEKTNRGDWMMWLEYEGAWKFTSKQFIDYVNKSTPLYADYQVKCASLNKNYNVKIAQMDDEFPEFYRKMKLASLNDKVKLASLNDDYKAKLASINDDYRARRAPIDDDYQAKRAKLIRSIIENPFK